MTGDKLTLILAAPLLVGVAALSIYRVEVQRDRIEVQAKLIRELHRELIFQRQNNEALTEKYLERERELTKLNQQLINQINKKR
jgi:hypothetical protein